MPVTTIFLAGSHIGRPSDNVRGGRTDFLVTAWAAIGLHGRRSGDAANYPVAVGVFLNLLPRSDSQFEGRIIATAVSAGQRSHRIRSKATPGLTSEVPSRNEVLK